MTMECVGSSTHVLGLNRDEVFHLRTYWSCMCPEVLLILRRNYLVSIDCTLVPHSAKHARQMPSPHPSRALPPSPEPARPCVSRACPSQLSHGHPAAEGHTLPVVTARCRFVPHSA